MTQAAQANLRLGTRGSLLARTQSQLIADDLEKRHPGLAIELVIITTTADQITELPLYEFGGKGLFTKELEQALLEERVDLAVHSFKDVPVTMPLVDQSDLVIAAVPEREDPSDVLVSSTAQSLSDLKTGARLGTSSLRRRCQALSLRPDLDVQPLRGNIDTRLKKLRDGQYDAIVLAYAGVHRAGLFDAAWMHPLPPEQMLPAPGQGALALQCRRNDRRTIELLQVINDPSATLCAGLERQVVAALQGDCHSPIAALARVEDAGQRVRVWAAVGARGGQPPVIRATAEAPVSDAGAASDSVTQSLSAQGAHQLLTNSTASP
jgi:hydroxymethylbilane synthase